MSWHDLNFSNDILTFCQDHGINPDQTTGRIWCWLVPNRKLRLHDSESPVAQPDRSFVLFSPELPNSVIDRTLTVRKGNHVTSGFLVSDALDYQKVCVVGDFTEQELAPLVQAGIEMTRVSGATPKQISDNLATALAN